MSGEIEIGGEEDENATENLNKAFKEFAKTTSAHGLFHVASARNFIVRTIWLLVMMGCIATLVLQFYPLYVKFQRRLVSTRLSMVRESRPQFPTVVVCNLNRIKKNKSARVKKECYFDVSSVGREGSLIGDSSTTTCLPLNQHGHQFYEMVTRCSWRSNNDCLKPEYWQKFWEHQYGNCFAFNSGFDWQSDPIEVRNISRSGSGLALSLNIQKHEYESTTTSTGVKLLVADQGVLYNMYTYGVSLSPGFHHRIALNKRVYKRVDPFNNGSCVKNIVTRLSSEGRKTTVTKYTQDMCYMRCLARQLNYMCHCLLYWVPQLLDNHVPICDKNTTGDRCAGDVERRWNAGELPCLSECHAPCEETRYAMQISADRLYAQDGVTELYTRENMLNVNVLMQELSHERVEEYETYLVEDLLGDLGGLLGLFSGLSLLTIVEIALFVGHISYIIINTCCRNLNIEK